MANPIELLCTVYLPATFFTVLAYVYTMQGKTNRALSIISRLTTEEGNIYVHPMYISIIYGALGDTDKAFEWLEKGYAGRSEWMVYLQVEHM